MSENTILPASSATDMSYQDSLQSVEHARRQAVVNNTTAEQEKKTNEPAKEETQVMGESLNDVRLQFRIDPDTNDVTVVIVDRESQKVIRTVPPQELSDLVDGNLLEFRT